MDLVGSDRAACQAPLIQGSCTHQQLPQQQPSSRRFAENDSYGDVQPIRAARYETNSPRGQFIPRQYASNRPALRDGHGPYAIDRVESDIRPRGEPRPEDVVVPSIEKDEPGSANSPHPYVSRQERSLMQITTTQAHEGLQGRRRMEPQDDHRRRVLQDSVIDLTDSPARGPRELGPGREHITIPTHEAARVQPSSRSTDEKYCDRRPLGRVVDPRTRPVGENKSSFSFFLKLFEQIEGYDKTETSEQIGPASSGLNDREYAGLANDTRSNARPPEHLKMHSSQRTLTSHIADKQIHEHPIPSKRRSGDFMAEEPITHEGRPAYSVRRRLNDEVRGPGRVLGTIDTPIPNHGSGGPLAAERLIREPYAGRENLPISSPTRMRLSRTHDELSANEVPARQGLGSGPEYRPVSRAHYYDYRPSNGDARRHEDLAGTYH